MQKKVIFSQLKFKQFIKKIMNIELSHINCFYGKHQALNDVSLCYPLGETIVLLGQSGAGKSSLLKVFDSVATQKCWHGFSKLQPMATFNRVGKFN